MSWPFSMTQDLLIITTHAVNNIGEFFNQMSMKSGVIGRIEKNELLVASQTWRHDLQPNILLRLSLIKPMYWGTKK